MSKKQVISPVTTRLPVTAHPAMSLLVGLGGWWQAQPPAQSRAVRAYAGAEEEPKQEPEGRDQSWSSGQGSERRRPPKARAPREGPAQASRVAFRGHARALLDS